MDAGNALQGLGRVGIGKSPHLIGCYDVLDIAGVHLLVQRSGLAFGPNAQHDYFFANENLFGEPEIVAQSDAALDLDFRRFIPLWPRHTLAFFSLTTLRSGRVDRDLARWQLFGVGGTNTVRGWEFAARTGKNQFLNTVEYRLTLLEPRLIVFPFNIHYRGGLQLGFFGDAGIGWDESREFAAKNFIAGFGAGLRLLVPIVGMVRFDLGWGQSGKSVFLHLGAFEKAEMARRRVR